MPGESGGGVLSVGGNSLVEVAGSGAKQGEDLSLGDLEVEECFRKEKAVKSEDYSEPSEFGGGIFSVGGNSFGEGRAVVGAAGCGGSLCEDLSVGDLVEEAKKSKKNQRSHRSGRKSENKLDVKSIPSPARNVPSAPSTEKHDSPIFGAEDLSEAERAIVDELVPHPPVNPPSIVASGGTGLELDDETLLKCHAEWQLGQRCLQVAHSTMVRFGNGNSELNPAYEELGQMLSAAPSLSSASRSAGLLSLHQEHPAVCSEGCEQHGSRSGKR